MKIITIICLLVISFPVFCQEHSVRIASEKDSGQVLEQIEKLLIRNPSGDLWYKKCLVHKERFDYPGSIAAVSKALEYDSTNTVYLSELADLHLTLGNSMDALQVLEKAIQSAPENVAVIGKYGKLLIGLQDYKEAYRVFSELRKGDSSNVFFNKQLALSAAYLGKNGEAKALFRKVLTMNPRDYGSYISLATLFQQDTAYSEALSALEKGLEQFPENPAMLLRKAQNYYFQNDYGRAIRDYEAYLLINDTLINIRKEYGATLYLNKDQAKALRILEPALYIVPNDPIVAMYVGLCYKDLKDFKSAKQYLELASKLAIPGYLINVYEYLGQVNGMLRDFPGAIAMYKKAYELDNLNHELLFQMATTCEEYQSDKTMAFNLYRQYLDKAGEMAPNRNYALLRINKIKEDRFFGN